MSRRKLNQMSVGIAHEGEVTYDAANLSRRFDENVLFARQFGNAIDFCTGLALKSEVIETRFHLVLYHD